MSKLNRVVSVLVITVVAVAAFSLRVRPHTQVKPILSSTFNRDFATALRSLEIAGANAASGDTAAQTMQLFGRLLMGFPDSTTYNTAVSGTSDVLKSMFGQDGLAGRISGTRDIIVTMATAAGITSCTSAPTSGTLTGTDGTGTWGTATNSAPSTYPKSGKYDKKLTWVGTKNSITTTASFEFFCDYNGMMMKAVDTVSSVDNLKYAIYYDRASDSDFRMDFYMWGKDGLMGTEDIKMALQLKYNDSTKVSHLSVTRAGSSVDQTTTCLGYRYVATIDLSTSKLSLYTVEVGTGSGSTHKTCSSFNAYAGATGTGVTSTTAPASQSTDNDYQGCFATFATNPSTVSTATTCSGLDLTAPDAPALDSTGNWSLAWIQANLKTKIEAL